MQDLKIKIESPVIGDAFKSFVMNYRTNIADYMNQIVTNDGSPCDSDVVEENGELVIYHIAPDKGYVMGEVEGNDTPFQVMKYVDLADEKRYLLLEQGRLSLFLKQPTGRADIRLGAFKTLVDAVSAWDSDPVKGKIEEAQKWKKALEKDAKRALKLAKAEATDAEVVQTEEENG